MEKIKIYSSTSIVLNLSTLGFSKKVFEIFQKSLTLDPKNSCARSRYGILYHEEGNILEAVEACNKALLTDPNYKLASKNLAMAFSNLLTRFELARNAQGLQKYCKATKANAAGTSDNLGCFTKAGTILIRLLDMT